jgi:hypothetical protein
MSEFGIDFEWPRAPKYELRPANAEQISQWLRANGPPRGVPEAEWPLHLAEIVAVGEPKDHRPKAEAMELAVKALVECKETPFHIVALKVVSALGPIFPGFPGDPVAGWRAVAERLRMMFEGRAFHWDEDGSRRTKEYKWPHPYTQQVGELGIYLVPDKDNKRVLALRPDELQAALVLYAARMIATGTTFNICEHCKTPFLSGGTRFRTKRGDARFCSSECRWKWHNESRRKAR